MMSPVPLVVAALLLLAACGSDGGSFCEAASEMERWDPARLGLGVATVGLAAMLVVTVRALRETRAAGDQA